MAETWWQRLSLEIASPVMMGMCESTNIVSAMALAVFKTTVVVLKDIDGDYVPRLPGSRSESAHVDVVLKH